MSGERQSLRKAIAAASILALATGAAVRADAELCYREGMRALEFQLWREAADQLGCAIRLQPQEGGKVLLYGMRSARYLPQLRLARAMVELGDCPRAVAALEASKAQGAQNVFERAEAENLAERCKGVAPWRPPGGVAGPGAVSPLSSPGTSSPATSRTPASTAAPAALFQAARAACAPGADPGSRSRPEHIALLHHLGESCLDELQGLVGRSSLSPKARADWLRRFLAIRASLEAGRREGDLEGVAADLDRSRRALDELASVL